MRDNHNKLPADPLSLVLGILALVIGLAGCCCYGITVIVPLVIAIVGLITANKSLKQYQLHPDLYSYQSRSNVNTAKIINIIAIVLNSLILLFSIAIIAFYGTLLSSGFYDEILKNSEYYDVDEYEAETDTLNWDKKVSEIGVKQDSLNIESTLEQKEINNQ